jgi:hypothetical protein
MRSSTGSRLLGAVLTIALTGMAIGLLIGTMEEARFVHDPAPAFAAVAGGAIFFALLRGPVGRAIARMLEGGGAEEQLGMRVEELEAQVSELHAEQARVAELEERVDFTERLLAQRDAMPSLRRPEE